MEMGQEIVAVIQSMFVGDDCDLLMKIERGAYAFDYIYLHRSERKGRRKNLDRIHCFNLYNTILLTLSTISRSKVFRWQKKRERNRKNHSTFKKSLTRLSFSFRLIFNPRHLISVMHGRRVSHECCNDFNLKFKFIPRT